MDNEVASTPSKALSFQVEFALVSSRQLISKSSYCDRTVNEALEKKAFRFLLLWAGFALFGGAVGGVVAVKMLGG